MVRSDNKASDICTSDLQYYRLALDDYSAAAFCSFGKYYFGTLDEICAFINTVDKECEDSHRELVSAYRAYEAGQTDATHHVAFQEVPLLTPTTLLHKEKIMLENYAWDHLNAWESVYKIRCKKVESEHLWLECEGRAFRAVKVTFKRLRYKGALGEWKPVNGKVLWGFPCIIRGDSSQIQSMLAEPEREFSDLGTLEQDWEAFMRNPVPDYTGFCDDIFGDG